MLEVYLLSILARASGDLQFRVPGPQVSLLFIRRLCKRVIPYSFVVAIGTSCECSPAARRAVNVVNVMYFGFS